jgi:GNAT superfamily N-acetyltransferase
MSFSDVATGQIAAIVTSLEMTDRPPLRAMPASDLRIVRWPTPTPEKYCTLYRRVGEPWLWFSRLELGGDALAAIIHDPKVRIWAVTDRDGIEIGLLELDFRMGGECEIAFFGFVPELAGKGNGTWLMAMALQMAWSEAGIKRLLVRTCTLDAHAALPFYIKSGFVPFRRQIETFPDPRLNGLIPRDAAPQIPIID